MISSDERPKRALQLAIYLALAVLMTTAVAWSALNLGTTAMGMIDAAVLDGSGRLAAPVETPVEAAKQEPHGVAAAKATQLSSSSETAVVTAVSAQKPVPVAAPKVSTDSPEHDAAWDFHKGASETTFKTYCVRLCDGYFWPVSFSTTADRFERDQEACASQCGTPARLFVHEIPGGGPGTMVSLDGLPYSALKTAFQFRVSYNAQCRCQAQPWEKQAQDRHKLFAAVDAARKGDKAAAQQVVELRATVEAAQRVAEVTREELNQVATRELQQLSRRANLEPPVRKPKPTRPTQLVAKQPLPGFMGLGGFTR